MILPFLYSFPLFLFLALGIFELCEHGTRLGAAQQISFFSAREEHLKGNTQKTAEYTFRALIDPFYFLSENFNLQKENSKTDKGQKLKVSLPPTQFFQNYFGRFEYEGTTPIPYFRKK